MTTSPSNDAVQLAQRPYTPVHSAVSAAAVMSGQLPKLNMAAVDDAAAKKKAKKKDKKTVKDRVDRGRALVRQVPYAAADSRKHSATASLSGTIGCAPARVAPECTPRTQQLRGWLKFWLHVV